jgi:hypothetical protein
MEGGAADPIMQGILREQTLKEAPPRERANILPESRSPLRDYDGQLFLKSSAAPNIWDFAQPRPQSRAPNQDPNLVVSVRRANRADTGSPMARGR